MRAVPQGQLSNDRKTDALEDITRQFENQMQEDKNWTYTKSRNEHQQKTSKMAYDKTVDHTQQMSVHLIHIQL